MSKFLAQIATGIGLAFAFMTASIAALLVPFLTKIVEGFALGLGFALAVLAVLHFSSGMMMGWTTGDAFSEAEVRISEGPAIRRFKEGADIVVKSHRERRIRNGMEILAEIENTSDITWSSIDVEIELFDAQNQFVDECSKYVRGDLSPQQTKNVKIKCGGCQNNPLPEFSSYTIKVVDASKY